MGNHGNRHFAVRRVHVVLRDHGNGRRRPFGLFGSVRVGCRSRVRQGVFRLYDYYDVVHLGRVLHDGAHADELAGERALPRSSSFLRALTRGKLILAIMMVTGLISFIMTDTGAVALSLSFVLPMLAIVGAVKGKSNIGKCLLLGVSLRLYSAASRLPSAILSMYSARVCSLLLPAREINFPEVDGVRRSRVCGKRHRRVAWPYQGVPA